ncbi:MAG: aspartate kinase [Anaerolineales bacterium]|nr:aspartate kinase [Anaerolineales bacterium]
MIVHKFGGTSITDAAGFLAAGQIILNQPHPSSATSAQNCAVVLSAIHGLTGALIQGGRLAAQGDDSGYRKIRLSLLEQHQQIIEELPLAKNQQRILIGVIEDNLHELERLYRSIAILGELTRRARDTVAAFGPILAVHILSSLLQELGLRAEPVCTANLLILDNSFGAAVPQMKPTGDAVKEHLAPMIHSGIVPILTASIGTTAEGVPAMLERGGGDTSAVALAAALHAAECFIWTDVDGILTADPAFVADAIPLPELSYPQAAELARFGADVLHPDTLQPGARAGFPLQIRSSFHPSRSGTRISNMPAGSDCILPAILSMTGLSMIVVHGEEHNWSLQIAARMLDTLFHTGVEVLMFSQPMSAPGLNLIIREQDQEFAIKSLQQTLGQTRLAGLTFEHRQKAAIITIVSINGSGAVSKERLFSETFSALGEKNTPVFAIARSANGSSLSFCIPEESCGELVAFLHKKLIMG